MRKMKKDTSVVYFMSCNNHRIFYDKEFKVYLVAIKRDGTDNVYLTLDEAMDAIYEEESK